jgi:hypothetical protein
VFEAAEVQPPPAVELPARKPLEIDLDQLVGRYEHAGYGIVEIERPAGSAEELQVRMGAINQSFFHLGGLRFSAPGELIVSPETSQPGILPFEIHFEPGSGASRGKLQWKLDPAAPMIEFVFIQY